MSLRSDPGQLLCFPSVSEHLAGPIHALTLEGDQISLLLL